MSIAEYTLAHHGIKGQKWGVRRFQNADGTLTEKGRKRYNKAVYKEIVNRTAMGRSVVKGNLVNEIIDEIRPRYEKHKIISDNYHSLLNQAKNTQEYKKIHNKYKKQILDNNYEIIDINGKERYRRKSDGVITNKAGADKLASVAAEFGSIIEYQNSKKNKKVNEAFELTKKADREYYDYVEKKIVDALGKYKDKEIDDIKVKFSTFMKIEDYLKTDVPDIPTKEEITSASRKRPLEAKDILAGAIASGIMDLNNPKYQDYDYEPKKKK